MLLFSLMNASKVSKDTQDIKYSFLKLERQTFIMDETSSFKESF